MSGPAPRPSAPAGFHVIGDAAVAAVVDAFEQVVDRLRDRLRSPAAATGWSTWRWSPRNRPPSWVPGASSPACSPEFDALWGGADGMYAERLGADRGARLNPLALLASQGVPLAFGSDAPVTRLRPVGERARSGPSPHPRQRGVGAGGVRRGNPRGLAGRRGPRRPDRDPGARARPPRTPCGTAEAWSSTQPHRDRRDTVQRWSTDRAPGSPRCRGSARTTPYRVAARPCTGVRSSMADDRRPDDADADEVATADGQDDVGRAGRVGQRASRRRTAGRIRDVRRGGELARWWVSGRGRCSAALLRMLRTVAVARTGRWLLPRLARLTGDGRRRSADVCQLSAVELVVGRRRRLRATGVGADASRHHAGRRSGLRLPVRSGVLPAAAAVDQHAGGRRCRGWCWR